MLSESNEALQHITAQLGRPWQDCFRLLSLVDIAPAGNGAPPARLFGEMKAREHEPILASRKTVAALLDVHPSFVDRLVTRGDLDAVYLGRKCKRIRMESVRRFIQAQ